MQINTILIPFVIILGILFSNNDTRKNKLLYIILCSSVFIFVAAMCSPEWMTYTYHIDTLVYKENFEESFDMNWSGLWSSAYLRYFNNVGDGDIGYLILNKLISLFTHDFHIYSILVDLVFFVPFGIILYRYTTGTRQVIFAFVFYIALVQIFMIGGGRQITAIGLDMMALLSLMDNKKIRAIVYFIIGVTIHFSSFLFLVPLLMIWFHAKPQFLKWSHIVCFLLFPIVLAFPNQIITFMGESAGLERYARYGQEGIQGGIGTFIVLIEFLSLFCLVAIKKGDLVNSFVYRTFYVMLPLLTFFGPLIRSNGSMIRISLYYHLYLVLLVPFAIDCMFKKKETRSAVYLVAIGALALLTLSGGGITYYFFWQQ